MEAGLTVVHLFGKPTPALDRDAVVAAVKDAEADGCQVITAAMLGHKADISFMALAADWRTLRTLQSALHTGIQRVVRGLWQGLQACSHEHGITVLAVRFEGDSWYSVVPLPPHHLQQAGTATGAGRVTSRPLAPRAGDTLLMADASWYLNPWPAVDALLAAGGRVLGLVHDLLPALRAVGGTPRNAHPSGTVRAVPWLLDELPARSL